MQSNIYVLIVRVWYLSVLFLGQACWQWHSHDFQLGMVLCLGALCYGEH